MNARTSYLVAATGNTRGVLTQVFASDPAEAERVVGASCIDWLGEVVEARCIDTGAAVGLHIVGDAHYINSILETA